MNNLFEHQKSGIEFLKKAGKAILADEMGLGKTRQAIVASQEIRDRALGPGVLVVCPASLKINWEREIRMVYPRDEIVILSTDEDDDPDDPRRTQWFIINYDILEKRLDYLLNLAKAEIIDTLILDEAHYIKGKSIRAKCIVGGKLKKNGGWIAYEGIADKMKQVYCLTGTPLLNRPIELFNLLKAIGHELGKVRMIFARRYCDAFFRKIWIKRNGIPVKIRILDESGARNLDELRERIKESFLRRKKKEVLNLPPKITSIMDCEMNEEWKKAYDTAFDAYLEFLKANPIEGKNIDNILMARHMVEITKLKQVCSRSKVKRILADIENAVDQGEKVIIFSQYTETIRQIAEGAREIKYDTGKTDNYGNPILEPKKVVTLTGEDDMNERQKAVDEFQNDSEVVVFVANIKAGGVGLNLTAASIVMFADMDWSPEIHNQAEDRAHRIGQEGTVNIYYYICGGTIEEDIVGILNAKKHIADQIFEGTAKRLKKGSAQEDFLRLMAKKVINR